MPARKTVFFVLILPPVASWSSSVLHSAPIFRSARFAARSLPLIVVIPVVVRGVGVRSAALEGEEEVHEP